MDPRMVLVKLLDQRPDGLERLRFLGPTPDGNVEVCVTRYLMPKGVTSAEARAEERYGHPFVGDDLTEEAQFAVEWLEEQGIILREEA